jgi:hypothetical protein
MLHAANQAGDESAAHSALGHAPVHHRPVEWFPSFPRFAGSSSGALPEITRSVKIRKMRMYSLSVWVSALRVCFMLPSGLGRVLAVKAVLAWRCGVLLRLGRIFFWLRPGVHATSPTGIGGR